MIEDCTALILAGGDSRRMGQDKASLLFDGETLLARVAGSMQQVFPEVIVSVRSHRPEALWRQVCDDPKQGGPLAGVLAGMAAAQHSWLFVLGCDMPFIAPPLVEQLANMRGDYQAVVPVAGGHAQPLAAFYARSLLPELQGLAQTGVRGLRDMLPHLRVNYVDETVLRMRDPSLRSFVDLDTPQDVEAARKRG